MEPCLQMLELMNAVLDGEATAAQKAQLNAHLEHCPACAALHEDLLALREGSDALLACAPDGFADRVMESVRSAAAPAKPRRRWKSIAAMAAVCAIALLGSGSLKYLQNGYMTSGGSQAPVSPASAEADSAEISGFAAGDFSQDHSDILAKQAGDTGDGGLAPEALSPQNTDPEIAPVSEPYSISAAQSPPQNGAVVPSALPSLAVSDPSAPELRSTQGETYSDAAVLSPRRALEMVVERTNADSGYTLETSYTQEGDTLFCEVRLLDGETVVDESKITYMGLSANQKYYRFLWSWADQDERASMEYAVPLSGGYVMWEGDVADGGESFRAALEE